MGKESQIQWTDATWNVARGCTKVDEDCKYCYMYRDSMDSTRYNPLQVVRTKTVFDLPLRYKETKSKCWDGPPLIFTSSLTDFFHEAIDSYRNEAWDIIRKCPHLTFQILTKRPERIMQHLPHDWGEGWDNVWLGTSVGATAGRNRINELIKVPAKIRFLSLEPLHERIDLEEFVSPCGYYCDHDQTAFDKFTASERFNAMDDNSQVMACSTFQADNHRPVPSLIHWVIVGGESGNNNGKYRFRPCSQAWIEKIVDQCTSENIPVFVKQLGTFLSNQLHLSDRHGGDINEFPDHLRIRQFPKL